MPNDETIEEILKENTLKPKVETRSSKKYIIRIKKLLQKYQGYNDKPKYPVNKPLYPHLEKGELETESKCIECGGRLVRPGMINPITKMWRGGAGMTCEECGLVHDKILRSNQNRYGDNMESQSRKYKREMPTKKDWNKRYEEKTHAVRIKKEYVDEIKELIKGKRTVNNRPISISQFVDMAVLEKLLEIIEEGFDTLDLE